MTFENKCDQSFYHFSRLKKYSDKNCAYETEK